MLWQKAWLETRRRFVGALLILTVLAGGTVYEYAAVQRLLPRLNAAGSAPIAETSGVADAIRDAMDIQKNFRGFVWYQSFRQNLTQLGVFFAMLLGCGGLVSESMKGSGLFTLSLPVTRRQLVSARALTGLAQWFAVAMTPPLAIVLLAPTVGERLPLVDALVHGFCIFVVGSVFFALASFLSTIFADMWRPLLIGIGVACAIAVLSFAVPQLALFSVMSGERYFRTGSLPWTGLLVSVVLTTALLYGAADTLERKDF